MLGEQVLLVLELKPSPPKTHLGELGELEVLLVLELELLL